jgi:DNA-binding MarR family transcriptional regulator
VSIVPLQGTLDVLRFADVALLLSKRRQTGRLEIRSADAYAHFFLERGDIVGMEAHGHVPDRYGEVRSRVVAECAKLLAAEHGSFAFRPGAPTDETERVHIDIRTLLRDARTYLQQWRRITATVPSLDVRPVPRDELTDREVTLSSEQWRVLRAVDGRHTVRALARILELPELEVTRSLKELIDAGVVEIAVEAAVVDGDVNRSAVTIEMHDAADDAVEAVIVIPPEDDDTSPEFATA